MIRVGDIVMYRDHKLHRLDWGRVVEVVEYCSGSEYHTPYFWESELVNYVVEREGRESHIGYAGEVFRNYPRFDDIVPLTGRLMTWDYPAIADFRRIALKLERTTAAPWGLASRKECLFVAGRRFPNHAYCQSYWENPDFPYLLAALAGLPEWLDLTECAPDLETHNLARKYTWLAALYRVAHPEPLPPVRLEDFREVTDSPDYDLDDGDDSDKENDWLLEECHTPNTEDGEVI